MSSLWSIRRVALYGAIFGAVYSIGREVLVDGTDLTDNVSHSIGLLIGGVLGGAGLFALIAWVRNIFARPKGVR
jgi:hypothetical protein